MGLYEIADSQPNVPPEVYLAPGSQVVGDVTVGRGSSVWVNAVIRGDQHPVPIGEDSNIQDSSAVRAAGGPCQIGDQVTVGIAAVLLGCKIGDRAMIGSGAVILDGAIVGEESIVAAQSLVRVGFRVPPGCFGLHHLCGLRLLRCKHADLICRSNVT